MPSRRLRARLALIVGVLAGSFSVFCLGRPGFDGDFEFPFRGARLLLAGVDPYGITEYAGRVLYGGAPLFYPLPTLWLIAPLTWLPSHWAGGILFGAGSAGLAYAITRDGLWRLHVFTSGSFVMAASLAQWSPLLTLAALVPAAGVLMVLKPTLGLAAFAYRPSWRTAAITALVLAVSVAALPQWPLEWLRGGRASIQHVVPLFSVWGGPLLLLALLRWRTRAGRLLMVMSIVPHFLFFYDELLFWLIPRSRKQSLFLTGSNLAGTLLWMGASFWTQAPFQLLARPFVMIFCYLPALVLVLRQPNLGECPHG